MKISILGTGAMGTAMGTVLLEKGNILTVYNRTIEKTTELKNLGAKVVSSPFQAIEASDVIIFVLLDGKAVKEILEQENISNKLKNKIIINTSTSTSHETMEIYSLVKQNGGTFAEVSMQADPETLKNSSGTMELGCELSDEALLTVILLKFSSEVNRIGEIGDVSNLATVSLFNSMLSLGTLAYSVAVAQKLEIKSEAYAKVLENTSSLAPYYLPNMIHHNYDMVYGDVGGNYLMGKTMLNLTKELGILPGFFEEMQNLLKKAKQAGYEKNDATSILEVLLKN